MRGARAEVAISPMIAQKIAMAITPLCLTSMYWKPCQRETGTFSLVSGST